MEETGGEEWELGLVFYKNLIFKKKSPFLMTAVNSLFPTDTSCISSEFSESCPLPWVHCDGTLQLPELHLLSQVHRDETL